MQRNEKRKFLTDKQRKIKMNRSIDRKHNYYKNQSITPQHQYITILKKSEKRIKIGNEDELLP